VVELHDEGDLVGVLARAGGEHAQGRGHGVAAAFDGQLHDVLGVEVLGVLREGRAGGMLDALVHGKDRNVARAREAAVTEELLEAAQHRHRPIARVEDPIDGVRPGQVQRFLRDRRALVLEQRLRVLAQVIDEAIELHFGGGH
jgi:hypothetical protein